MAVILELLVNMCVYLFQAACETFCTGDERALLDATGTLSTTDHHWTPDTFRVTPATGIKEPDILTGNCHQHHNTTITFTVTETTICVLRYTY